LKKSLPFEFLALGALWGSSFMFMQVGGHAFGIVPTVALRVMIAAVALFIILYFSGQFASLRQHWLKVFVIGVINSAIPFALFTYAVMHINTGLTAILNATVPLFGALIAWIWLKDRLTGLRILGLVLGFIGIALLTGDQASFKPGGSGMAVLACLAAAICYGLAASLAKRYLSEVPPLASATGSQIGASLVLAIPCWLTWPSQNPGLHAWASMLFLGVMCTGVAYILYFRIINEAGPTIALAVTFLIPVFATFYGVIFLDEVVTQWMLMCALITVLGTALSTGMLKWPRMAGLDQS
jgi:drug/metabolite transporter (DMT)-like permease